MGLYPKIEKGFPPDLPQGLNSKQFFVDRVNGDDNDLGDRRERPLASITEALSRCTNATYDTIYVTQSVHVEATQPIVCNVQGVHIMGLPGVPDGGQAHTWIFPSVNPAGGIFNIGAGDVRISNFMIWGTAGQPCIDFSAEATAVRIWIDHCAFSVGTYGVQTGPAPNQPSHYLTITNCFFDPTLTVGGIGLFSNGSWPLIADNFFEYVPGPVIDVNIAANSAGGRILRNHIILPADDTVGDGIYIATGNTRYLVADNYCNNAAPDAITNNPFMDVDNASVWMNNLIGGGADTAPA
jgi:hypothetical protein